MIVDKQNNLNIYKEDTRKVGEGEKASNSSCCSSDGTKDDLMTATQSTCCGSTKKAEVVQPKPTTSSCCGTSNQTTKEGSKNVMEIDFNEWVGESLILGCTLNQSFADYVCSGSFSVYAVKP